MSQAWPATSLHGMRATVDRPRVALLLTLALLVAPACLSAASEPALLCNYGGIAKHLIEGNLQKALDLSVECEELNLANIKENLAPTILKSAYLVSAQILTAQGKFDLARERIGKARELPDTFVINLDELLVTAEGYLLEQSGQTAQALAFYRKISDPYASIQIGKIYFDTGRTDEALRIIRDSLKSDPSSPAAHAILGEILEKSDRTAALREYKRALALAKDRLTVVALVYIDVSRAKRGIDRLRLRRH